MEEKKKTVHFNIIKNDPLDGHKGYNAGVLNLENVTPVFIDVAEQEAFIDIGAMHAKSKVEKGLKFVPNIEELPNPKWYWLVWVTVERNENGPFYYGVTACDLATDREARRGYKIFPDHVNKMDKSLKGHFIVDHMDEPSKKTLAKFLQNQEGGLWKNSSAELKKQLGVE
ncbi:YwhD family protein [Pallidibacillus thermolactis]|uniref:YwhD family protein n=1 Tax=Pallidibacillus thermolactis TaxID=251051 RepID=UPI00156B17BD|nr:YwhD family protein [Pallidibacillus thermolactis]MCU9600209.1 YwhD family protein [Pallidibacillus thermolactis subsp. kokeshiiformis]MED1673417.1 YwhD family protein [Pallidibacillus thermolactis subsp. kokeshiiformis]